MPARTGQWHKALTCRQIALPPPPPEDQGEESSSESEGAESYASSKKSSRRAPSVNSSRTSYTRGYTQQYPFPGQERLGSLPMNVGPRMNGMPQMPPQHGFQALGGPPPMLGVGPTYPHNVNVPASDLGLPMGPRDPYGQGLPAQIHVGPPQAGFDMAALNDALPNTGLTPPPSTTTSRRRSGQSRQATAPPKGGELRPLAWVAHDRKYYRNRGSPQSNIASDALPFAPIGYGAVTVAHSLLKAVKPAKRPSQKQGRPKASRVPSPPQSVDSARTHSSHSNQY